MINYLSTQNNQIWYIHAFWGNQSNKCSLESVREVFVAEFGGFFIFYVIFVSIGEYFLGNWLFIYKHKTMKCCIPKCNWGGKSIKSGIT